MIIIPRDKSRRDTAIPDLSSVLSAECVWPVGFCVTLSSLKRQITDWLIDSFRLTRDTWLRDDGLADIQTDRRPNWLTELECVLNALQPHFQSVPPWQITTTIETKLLQLGQLKSSVWDSIAMGSLPKRKNFTKRTLQCPVPQIMRHSILDCVFHFR